MNDCINNCCGIDPCTLLLFLCCCGNGCSSNFNMGSNCCNIPLLLLLTCCGGCGNGFGNSFGNCK